MAMVRKLGYSYTQGGTKFYVNAAQSTRGVTTGYSYNAAHELTKMTSSAWNGAAVTRTCAYDQAGRLTTHVKQETGQANVTRSYEWDALDRLTKGQKVTAGSPNVTKTLNYAYNADGLRVRRTDTDAAVTKLYSYQGNNLASIQESSGGGFGSKDWVYTVAPGMISNALERHQPNYAGNSTQSQYYQYDHRGNVAVVSDSTGKVKYGYQYDAFGNIQSSFEEGASSAPTDDILFTGKDWDPDLELYYFNARWYDPETGRFLSRAFFRPNREKPYVFCRNNPISHVDANGRLDFVLIQPNPSSALERLELNPASASEIGYEIDPAWLMAWSAFFSACERLQHTTAIDGVPEKILQCLKCICDGSRHLNIVVGGLWCSDSKAGYTHKFQSTTIHVCEWVIVPNPNDPLNAAQRTLNPFLLHTIVHEMVHACGDRREGPGDPAEKAGFFVE